MMLGLGLAIQTYHAFFRTQLPIYATKFMQQSHRDLHIGCNLRTKLPIAFLQISAVL
jgi:hypothetical protein